MPAIDPYTHSTCVRRRHMVYYHITWLARKSNSPLLASDQSTVELCIPVHTPIAPRAYVDAISRGSAGPIKFGADNPASHPTLQNGPPPQFQKIIAKRTEQRLKRNQLLNTSMTYFDKLVQNFFWNYTASLELWIFPKLQTITALHIWSQPQFPYLAPGNCKYFCPPSDIPNQLQLL